MTSSDLLPALLGGNAVRAQGPPDWPVADDEVLRTLEAAYHDGSWGKYHGLYVERLEERLRQYHGLAFALTCASGTFAVELALRALKVGPGDEVILSAYDYPGNFLSVHAVGARPVLVDVHPGNWNLDPDRLKEAVGPATRVILVSHLHGGVVPMREVMALASTHGLRVIEDAAQAPGATIQGRRAGTWGDAGILSFGGSKLLSGGRGGALLTPHADVHQRARLCIHRGNQVCPLSELQAAVLLPQLDKLDARNTRRRQNVSLLTERLRDMPGLRLFDNPCTDAEPGYYKIGFRLDSNCFGLNRERLVASLRAEGIAFDAGFAALHVGRSPTRFRQAGNLTEAGRAHHGAIVLHHPVLLGTPEDIEEVVRALHKVRAHVEQLSGECRAEEGRM
jgi:dTDP-4-amino-4,6-dideoxygalactose transaminase